jgi:hypothetical protein
MGDPAVRLDAHGSLGSSLSLGPAALAAARAHQLPRPLSPSATTSAATDRSVTSSTPTSAASPAPGQRRADSAAAGGSAVMQAAVLENLSSGVGAPGVARADGHGPVPASCGDEQLQQEAADILRRHHVVRTALHEMLLESGSQL